MKKIASVLCVLALLLGMMAVSGISMTSAASENEKIYRAVLDMFYESISCQWSNCDNKGWGDPADPDNVAYMFPLHYKNADLSDIGYALIDIDQNGQDELMVSPLNSAEYGMIFDMYTVVDGMVVHVLSSGERAQYYLANDGSIMFSGSAGAMQSMTEKYSLQGSTGTLKLDEAVICDAYENPKSPYFYASGEYRDSDGYYDYRKLSSISQAQATAIKNSFPEIIPIPMTPLSEYDPNAAQLGDINGDEELDMRDAFAVYSAASGGDPLTAEQTQAADMNGDGEIDMRDAFILYTQVSGG